MPTSICSVGVNLETLDNSEHSEHAMEVLGDSVTEYLIDRRLQERERENGVIEFAKVIHVTYSYSVSTNTFRVYVHFDISIEVLGPAYSRCTGIVEAYCHGWEDRHNLTLATAR